MARKTDNDEQQLLPFDGGAESVSIIFKKLYNHLYTNCRSSRAERLISDLTFLLLTKLAAELNGGGKAIDRFLNAGEKADDVILPLLRQSYPKIVDDRDRFSMGDTALRESFRLLQRIKLSGSPAHVLGEAFQSLMGPRLRGDKGQFFTPRSLVRAMVDAVAPQSNESVLDPACGTGGSSRKHTGFRENKRAKAVLRAGSLASTKTTIYSGFLQRYLRFSVDPAQSCTILTRSTHESTTRCPWPTMRSTSCLRTRLLGRRSGSAITRSSVIMPWHGIGSAERMANGAGAGVSPQIKILRSSSSNCAFGS